MIPAYLGRRGGNIGQPADVREAAATAG
jgi:hypothetical protein